MQALIIISFVLLAGYCVLILAYFLGWLLIKQAKVLRFDPNHCASFTVLIAARNEENNIADCLNSLVTQDYPNASMEILVVNDHSADNTEAVILSFKDQYPHKNIQLINLSDYPNINNKKEGISLGVSLAKHEYIILTDADCTRKPLWLQSFDGFMKQHNVKLIYAPVFFSARNGFEKMQALEFAGLMGIGAAAIQLKNPNMCSAANLLFSKQAFFEVGGYKDNKHIASGDDEYLLHKVFKKYPNEVWFLKDKRAIVTTSPNGSLNQLAQQRKRWVSKSTKYEERYITAILVMAYLFNLAIPLNLILGIAYQPLLLTGIVLLLVKTLVEGLFLWRVCAFFKRSDLLLWLPPAEPFHILYVLIIGIWANVSSYTWKNRTHHS